MAYQLPDGTLIRAPRRGRSFVIDGVRHPEIALQYWGSQGTLGDFGITEVPDPQPAEPTAEYVAKRERDQRQTDRIRKLQGAVLDQFDMILALFQVGRNNGVWVAGDFPAELRVKVQEWQDIIDNYRAEDVDETPEA